VEVPLITGQILAVEAVSPPVMLTAGPLTIVSSSLVLSMT
jgi:hypothetical protein